MLTLSSGGGRAAALELHRAAPRAQLELQRQRAGSAEERGEAEAATASPASQRARPANSAAAGRFCAGSFGRVGREESFFLKNLLLEDSSSCAAQVGTSSSA